MPTKKTPDTKTPDYDLFITETGSNNKTFYTRIGAAWKHSKGDGINISLQAIPVDGSLVAFPHKTKAERDAEKKAEK